MGEISIEPLPQTATPEASRVLARAFVTNPMHVAAFGAGALAKNEAFFAAALAMLKGPKWIAADEARLVGVVHWVDSSQCQMSLGDRVRALPAMVRGFGVGSTLKVGSWLAAWAKHDPGEPHVHLGPIGVLPDAQGRHVGRRLMERFCDEIDRSRQAGYLETDRPENVAIYRRFGFETTEEATILGVRSYFMWRRRR